jgi:hypothetical protein
VENEARENEMNLYVFAISLVLYSTFLFSCEINEETKEGEGRKEKEEFMSDFLLLNFCSSERK